MRRIYFLVPDIATTKRIVDELLLSRIEEKHIHVLAKRGTQSGRTTRSQPASKERFCSRGGAWARVGGTAGALAGLVAIALPLPQRSLAGGILLGAPLQGRESAHGPGSMIGVSTANSRVKQFEEAIEAGQLLVLADVPKKSVAEIEARIKAHLPQVNVEGTEPIIPAFP